HGCVAVNPPHKPRECCFPVGLQGMIHDPGLRTAGFGSQQFVERYAAAAMVVL
ncbi:hypothetical protein LCGC14_0940050, partial [marine sediment metagenome]